MDAMNQNLFFFGNRNHQNGNKQGSMLIPDDDSVAAAGSAGGLMTGFTAGGLLDQYLKQQQDLEPNNAFSNNAFGNNIATNNGPGIVNPMEPMKMGFGSDNFGMGGGEYNNNNGPAKMASNEYPQVSNSRNSSNIFLQRLQGLPGAGVGGGMPLQKPANWIGDMTGEGDAYAESGILGPWSARSAGLLGSMFADHEEKEKKIRKRPKDKPKRPLSAYNIFFKEERTRILEALPESQDKTSPDGTTAPPTRKRKTKPHGKIGFESLAKVVGQRWQDLTAEQVEYYKGKAEEDKFRYKTEMESYVASSGATTNTTTKSSDDDQQQQPPPESQTSSSDIYLNNNDTTAPTQFGTLSFQHQLQFPPTVAAASVSNKRQRLDSIGFMF